MIFGIDKALIRKYLEKISNVPYTVKLLNEDEFMIGTGNPEFSVKVNKPIKQADLLHSTSLTLGEAYMNRGIEIEGDLFKVLDIAMSQSEKFFVDKHLLNKLIHKSTSIKIQKKEVTSHYDIGNEFYKLWLGKTMNYSCAYFKNHEDNLDTAQENKIEHILSKLQLEEGMTLLDIGCGWGYLLLEAAKKYKIHGVGITLSEEQAKGFREKIQEERLQDYLEVKIMDYRELKHSNMVFDRVVSVGMIEHVGRKNYELFFENVDQILKPQGLFLLHFISGLKEKAGDPWIDKYIFPGGIIPTLREIIHICGDHRFYTLDVESLRQHYTKTLLCWYENYTLSIDKIRTMFDDRFIRMWELYLCSCAASFHNGKLDLHQILLSKGPNNNIPLTREHLYET